MGKNDKKLTVKLIIGKGKEQEKEEHQDEWDKENAVPLSPSSSSSSSSLSSSSSSPSSSKSSSYSSSFSIDVRTDGKCSRKATYDDLNRFTGKEITSDVLKDWVVEYQRKCFPEDLEEPNHTPSECFIRDEKKVCSIYKDFGWKPIKLNLKPMRTVDIQERRTKEVCLGKLSFDFFKTKEEILEQTTELSEHEVTSYMKRSNIEGHSLAKELMMMNDGNDEGTNIVTEFEGGSSTNSTTAFGVFGGEHQKIMTSSKVSVETDEDTGDKIWKETKTLQSLLRDVEFPTKGGGNSREANYYVVANECVVKARVYYKAFFVNDVVTVHPDKFRDNLYWKFPIKYLFQYNDEPNAIFLHEDVELKFYTDIRVSMDKKDWEWIKDPVTGNWKRE